MFINFILTFRFKNDFYLKGYVGCKKLIFESINQKGEKIEEHDQGLLVCTLRDTHARNYYLGDHLVGRDNQKIPRIDLLSLKPGA